MERISLFIPAIRVSLPLYILSGLLSQVYSSWRILLYLYSSPIEAVALLDLYLSRLFCSSFSAVRVRAAMRMRDAVIYRGARLSRAMRV